MKTKTASASRDRHASGVRIIPVVALAPLAPEVVPILRRFRLRRQPAFEYYRGALCLSVPKLLTNGHKPRSKKDANCSTK